jgi:HAD superfamily hydrolase (TIGR01509 family)
LTEESRRYRFGRLFDRAHTIIFDFDGVLADSEKYHFMTYRDVFARHGHHIDETEYYKYWTSLGQGPRGEIERHGLDLDPAEIRDEKRPVFSEYCRDGSIKLFPEAMEIVRTLASAGKHLTIASGTPRPDIEAILHNAGLDGAFSHIIGSDTVPRVKPAPDIFLAMLDATGAEPYECLVIEDAEKGMEASIAAEIPVVVIRTPETRAFDFSAADLILESHVEFLELARDHYR